MLFLSTIIVILGVWLEPIIRLINTAIKGDTQCLLIPLTWRIKL